jgi:hypothetical protein
VRKSLLGLVATLLLLLGGLLALSECSGEVVVLHTRDAAGREHATRLWVVEHAGRLWLRAGSRPARDPGSWFARLRAEPRVELERGGERRAFHAVVVPGEAARLDALMAERYGLADRILVSLRSDGPSTPVRLDPAAP